MNVAVFWLINEKGGILLSRRALHMSTDAGMWGPSVSGKVNTGETPRQAALREANEELGIEARMLPQVHHLHDAVHQHNDGQIRNFSVFYTYVDSSIEHMLRLEPNEVAATKWISLASLQQTYQQQPETLIVAHDAALWQEIFTALKRVIGSKFQNF